MYTTQTLGYYGQHAMQGVAMQGMGRLGDAAADYCASNPDACGGGGSSSGSSGTKKSASDWITDVLGWGKSATEIYDNTKGGGGGTTVINNSAPTATGMGLGTKVAIGAVGVLVVGGLTYALWPKKKK
jgi:hypothetical protein